MSIADFLSLYAIVAIWGMLLLTVTLSVGGYFYTMKCNRTDGSVIPGEGKPMDYPFVSIMVPAHNEALVLRRTVEALLSFDYPPERYEVIVINDNSSDETAELLGELMAAHPDRQLMCVSTDPVVGGKGKSNALNIGFSLCKGSVIAIYDADNTPARNALRLLTENLLLDAAQGAVIGKFRTRNRNASLLTRFVNIETLTHQCMNQAGRYHFFRLCTIPGTNYVIRRSIVEKIGGWDVKALSEDTEISFRIYRMGYYIGLIPQAVTWEQEPQFLRQWFKQRVRWAKGNLYVMIKNFKYTFDPQAGAMRLDTLYYALTYAVMLSSLVVSDALFVGGSLGIVHVHLTGFSPLLWLMAILVFVVNVMVTLSLEKNEFTVDNFLLTALMLFTYAKLWVFVVLKAIWDYTMDTLLHREVKWDKTVRYVEGEPSKGKGGNK